MKEMRSNWNPEKFITNFPKHSSIIVWHFLINFSPHTKILRKERGWHLWLLSWSENDLDKQRVKKKMPLPESQTLTVTKKCNKVGLIYESVQDCGGSFICGAYNVTIISSCFLNGQIIVHHDKVQARLWLPHNLHIYTFSLCFNEAMKYVLKTHVMFKRRAKDSTFPGICPSTLENSHTCCIAERGTKTTSAIISNTKSCDPDLNLIQQEKVMRRWWLG